VATLDLVSRSRAFLGLASGAWLDRIGLGDERALTGVSEAVEIVLSCSRAGCCRS
jgi:5,10-methylenetetrahydromethanopterin reductase